MAHIPPNAAGNYPRISPLQPHMIRIPQYRTAIPQFPNYQQQPPYVPGNTSHTAPYHSKRKLLHSNNSNVCRSHDDDKFLRAFEKRVCARRKHCTKIKVSTTLQNLGEIYQLLEDCKKSDINKSEVLRVLKESSDGIASMCTENNKRILSKEMCERMKKKKRKSDVKERRNAKIAALVTEIDHWRATMLAEEEKKKQDEELKSDAGNTLQQVIHKQRCTKRLLETVKLLIDLRDLRKDQAARRHGTFIEPDVDNRFKKNVDLMKSKIKEKLETFYAEEKTIKVLTEANEADIWGVEKKLRKLETLPDNVIDYSSVYLEIQYNPRTLIKIRRQWDDYIVAPATLHASRIPTTDLVPPANPSPEWAVYRKPGQSSSTP